MEFIIDNALILIPVLYTLGYIIKHTEFLKDKYIPLILLFSSMILSNLLLGFGIEATLQGILIAGTTVMSNEIKKQALKEE